MTMLLAIVILTVATLTWTVGVDALAKELVRREYRE